MKTARERPGGELRRTLTLIPLTLYGLGTIVGAGVYVLVGEVAGLAGMFTPVAFLLAALIAGLAAFSYAELSSRYPRSAGEVVYVKEGLGSHALSVIVGVLVVLAGVVSAATLANGFAGYLRVFVEVPAWLAVAGIVIVLGAVAAWGMAESATLAVIATVIELGGLLLVIAVSWPALAAWPSRWHELVLPNAAAWHGVMLGAFIAFYAFIGFEDMVNVAEEVKEPRRNMPRAILLAVSCSTLLYVMVASAAVLTVAPAELALHSAPLALVFERATGLKPTFIAIIGTSAVMNGALVQIIMAARVLYGMSREGWLPPRLGKVHPDRQTPLFATLLVTGFVVVIALWLPLITLAKTTSFSILVVFLLIHVSLISIKLRHKPPAGARTYPLLIPLLGVLSIAFMLGFQLMQVWKNS